MRSIVAVGLSLSKLSGMKAKNRRLHKVFIVVVLVFYVHGKRLRSVNLPTFFLGRLRPPKRLTSTSCSYFRK